MKRGIVGIVFLLIYDSVKSPNRNLELERIGTELKLIQNTIDWVNDSDIDRDMNARKNKLIEIYLYENE